MVKLKTVIVIGLVIAVMISINSISSSYAANDFSELDKAIKELEEGKKAQPPTPPPPIETPTPAPPAIPTLPEINVPHVPSPESELQAIEKAPEPIPEEAKPQEPQHSNAMEAKAMGHKGVVDVDARTRKVYRYDTIHNPPEFYRNNEDRNSYHLPKPFYKKDYKQIVFMAIRNDDIAALKYLHEDLKVPLNIRDEFGDSPLSAAIRYNKYKSIKYLLSKQAILDFGGKDMEGSAFYSAISGSNTLVIQLLDEYGYLRNLCAEQFIALWKAKNNFNTAILACIFNQMSQTQKNRTLLLMVCNEDPEGILFTLYHKADANTKTATGTYVLALAVKMEAIELIEAMLYCENLFSCASLIQAVCIADVLGSEDIFKLLYSSLLRQSVIKNCKIPEFRLMGYITNRERAYCNVFFDCKHSLKQRDSRDIKDCMPNNMLPPPSPRPYNYNCRPEPQHENAPRLLRR